MTQWLILALFVPILYQFLLRTPAESAIDVEHLGVVGLAHLAAVFVGGGAYRLLHLDWFSLMLLVWSYRCDIK